MSDDSIRNHHDSNARQGISLLMELRQETFAEGLRRAMEERDELQSQLSALRAAAVESERDAARYRFQHDNCLTFSPSRRLWELRDAAFLVVATGTAYTYEQAVDAAMAAQEKAK